MFTHPYTKEPLSFKSQEELLDFLSRLNPMMMRIFKKQYSEKEVRYILNNLELHPSSIAKRLSRTTLSIRKKNSKFKKKE